MVANQYKLLGELKKYERKANRFSKYFDSRREFFNEIRGNFICRSIGIPVTHLLGLSLKKKRIDSEFISLSRLDQIMEESRVEEFSLGVVREAVSYLVRLHRMTRIPIAPHYLLQQERLLRLQSDLYAFKNVPREVYLKIKKSIEDRLRFFRASLRNCCMIHGDFIMQNIFCGNDGGLIIFDWENSSWSDPVYDLACFLSFFFVVLVKSEVYTLADFGRMEKAVLETYDNSLPLSSFDIERYQFFRTLGHHCMYPFYILLIHFLKSSGCVGSSKFLDGLLSEQEFVEFRESLSLSGYVLKESSLSAIHRMLKRSSSNDRELLLRGIASIAVKLIT